MKLAESINNSFEIFNSLTLHELDDNDYFVMGNFSKFIVDIISYNELQENVIIVERFYTKDQFLTLLKSIVLEELIGDSFKFVAEIIQNDKNLLYLDLLDLTFFEEMYHSQYGERYINKYLPSETRYRWENYKNSISQFKLNLKARPDPIAWICNPCEEFIEILVNFNQEATNGVYLVLIKNDNEYVTRLKLIKE